MTAAHNVAKELREYASGPKGDAADKSDARLATTAAKTPTRSGRAALPPLKLKIRKTA